MQSLKSTRGTNRLRFSLMAMSKIVEIPIDHLTMVELASAKELLGWRVLTLVEQDDEKIRIAVRSRSELLCLHYRDHNGMPGMKTWLVELTPTKNGKGSILRVWRLKMP